MITSAGLILRSYTLTLVFFQIPQRHSFQGALMRRLFGGSMSQRTAWCRDSCGFHFHVNILQPSAGWPGSLCKAAHSQSELLQPGEAKQFNTLICMFPCNRWAEIDAEAASQHQEKLARAGKHPSQGVIFFGLPS